MVHFTKLRLSGFKSFVDPAELLIEPGVTGIVGPNGCGKSNLVEALRWVMGESSAKRMRGGEMDDIIFSGTANRPARNIAEAMIQLDNSDRRAPAMFNHPTDQFTTEFRDIAKGPKSAVEIPLLAIQPARKRNHIAAPVATMARIIPAHEEKIRSTAAAKC